MARRTFDVIDICEIFTHWHAVRSKSELAAELTGVVLVKERWAGSGRD